MPRRIRDYLDRLSHRDTHREEPNTYTVNTTVNLNDWQPVRWNATQWFPDNDVPPTRVYRHDMDNGLTQQMLENAYNSMTARDIMEMAEVAPERMLRLVRLNMPELNNNLFEERPMDPPRDWGAEAMSRATRVPASYFSPNENVVFSEYTPSWSNRTVNWWNCDRSHMEFRHGKIIRVKRYCKI